jgi:hypothetical protein
MSQTSHQSDSEASDPSGDPKRLEDCVITNDVTVSKLSRLQKRILVYAYKAMRAKGQKIKQPTDATINIPAPRWLSDALTKALAEVFKSRKYYQLGDLDLIDLHPWLRFFAEVWHVEKTLSAAAKEAGEDRRRPPKLTGLFQFADPTWGVLASTLETMTVEVLPNMDRRGWFFSLYVKGSRDELVQKVKDFFGDKDRRLGREQQKLSGQLHRS